jgi:pimeloyl-ACP methyl ester carboxylesterase
MKEEALLLGQSKSLVGIVARPPANGTYRRSPAVLILNAGIVHRVGPNRLYVKMARDLAANGLVTLRFDFSGIGDSGVRTDTLPFPESAVRETQEAMDYLAVEMGIERFVLMGICSGATTSFATACRDPRVVGAVLINARSHLHDTANERLDSHLRQRALARHYWRIALSSSFSRKNVARALTGKADYRRIVPAMFAPLRWSLFARRRDVAPGTNTLAAELDRLNGRGVRLLHVYSEGDEGLDYIHVILGDRLRNWHARGLLQIEIIPGANHTFSLLWSQEHLLDIIRRWIQGAAQEGIPPYELVP